MPARLTYDVALHRVTLDPTQRLRPHTSYRVVIATTVRDLAGNRLDQDAKQGRAATVEVVLPDPLEGGAVLRSGRGSEDRCSPHRRTLRGRGP